MTGVVVSVVALANAQPPPVNRTQETDVAVYFLLFLRTF